MWVETNGAAMLPEIRDELFIEKGREIGYKEGYEQGFAEGFERGLEDYRREEALRFTSLGMLLVEKGQPEDVERAALDIAYRKKLYRKYGIDG